MPDEDMTLETLLAVRKEIASDLDEALLQRCYQIQKRFQFSDDRTISATEMEKLIDAHVASLLDETRG
ncbi:DNA modification system-associated small protein [Pelagibacterium mangrovi]|uniref:DNA modification system-associated small protein n=1 Tax=Pelagibacterium mangrovi TaxID=3119828 RepID=UPI002FC6DDAE